MSTSTIDLGILNDPRRLAARRAGMEKLQGVFEGKNVGRVPEINGYAGVARTSILQDHRQWMDEVLADLARHADLILDAEVGGVFRPLVIRPRIYMVHFIDAILGAEVYDLDGTLNWQARVLEGPVGTLRPPELEKCPTWRLAKEVVRDFLSRKLALPFLEMPTLSSPLNIAMNLYGEAFLMAMIEDPDAARRDLRVITDLIVTLHRWYIANVPSIQLQPVATPHRCQPPGFGQICGCSTHLLSGKQYAEFIEPLDEEILAVHPRGGMIHLCGKHTQQIESFRRMRSLRALQVNNDAAADLAEYFAGTREDQVMYACLFDGMPLERVMEITGGRRVVVYDGGHDI
ncbi:MAG: hypothetical protein FWD61_04435 [Phycisphaerales bacterium]|nr:hypothetical protein [Phycisphaerales bacterium]